jgi:cytochrome c biogenesis protein CcmG, thiol:disulfide interchange protein DsbE
VSKRLFRRLAPLWLLVTVMSVHPASAEAPSLDLAAYRGKVVVVDFWASWCVPCRRSIPWLNAMQCKYADKGLVVIGVNVDAERTDAERFLAETPAQFHIVYDSKGQLPKQLGVIGMPSSFIYDRSGQLVTKHIGFQNGKRDEYEQVLVRTLKGSSE